MSKKVRPYQAEGIKDIYNAWAAGHNVVMFVLATGGGKTFTFTDIIKEFLSRGKRAWLIAHRDELITQSWQTLYDARIMAGVVQAEKPTNYALPAQVTSIQTIIRRRKLPPEPDLIVVDEGHHVQKKNTYGTMLNRYPNALILIVTATPYRLSGEGFVDIIDGHQTHLIINRTLKDLIEDGWLVPLRYHIGATPDLSQVDTSSGDYDEKQAAQVMGMAPIVESYLQHCNGEQGLCFCVNVAHSKEVCKKYNDAGIKAIHIDADTPMDARRDALAAYRRGEVLVVCNVAIFTEGTDFPFCQFVQHAAPSKSLSNVFQKTGRGTRALGGIVDLYDTAQERIDAIAASAKPFCKILDNAGLWREDIPFADEDVNWEYYFKGWKQDKKKKTDEEPEYIEIPVYEVEDPVTGARKKTKNIEEVDGMVLIEITKEMRRNLKAMKHLKEFDRLYDFGLKSSKVNKPGYFAYYKFLEYCNTEEILIEDIAWKYIREKLVDNIDTEINEYIAKAQEGGRVVIPSMNEDIKNIREKGVMKYFLKREWETYKQGFRRPAGGGVN